MRRYLILLSAVIMQLCLGSTYSWAIWVQPLKILTGFLQGPIHLPFTVFYIFYPATMFFAGSLVSRIGPRKCALVGGLVFGGGWMMAGLGEIHFAFTVIGIGVLGGAGVGLAYIVPITTCIQWFPKSKGLVTGIAVAGFGGGAALVSQVGGYLMNSWGATPFKAFFILGFCFFSLIVLASLAMQYPPDYEKRKIQPLILSDIVTRPLFWLLYLSMFSGVAAGLAVNANLKELYVAGGVQLGITAVSVFAIANALGRIIWGLIIDRIQWVTVIQANSICQAVLLFSAFWALSTETGFLLFSFFAGLNYGGVLVIYASSIAIIWGNERVAKIYCWLFSVTILASLSPILSGVAYDFWGNFIAPFLIIGILLICASFLVGKARGIWNEEQL